MDQAEKAHRFRELHEGPDVLLLPNPWDAGTAKMLAGAGFHALATTSAGLAWSLGRCDGDVARDDVLANARAICAAVDLPVAADLENGYAEEASGVGETIARAAAAGLVGASIEDYAGPALDRIYPLETAVKRLEAAVAAARSLPFPFTLVARCENFLHDVDDLDDTIRRLQAYEAAGADVLYAPFLPNAEAIRRVCSAVAKPVNVLAAGFAATLTVAQLAELGVRRISLGSGLTRVAFGAFLSAARSIQSDGTFAQVIAALPSSEIVRAFD